MLNVGIIGCGKIAQVRHIPEYLANKETNLYGFYDLNMDRSEELAEKYNGKAYSSVEEMLQDEAVDAVSVCVANNMHAEITIAALLAGKHVLCEKPMSTNLADCEAMVEAAKKSGKKLVIDQNQRLTTAHRKAKELLLKGSIGHVNTFRTTFGHKGPETWSIDPGKETWFFDRKRAAMGAMADLGVHKTDLIQYLLGTTVVEITAKVVTLDKKYADGTPIGVDDNAICIYQMSDGAIGTMTASWTYYGGEDNTTVLFGTEGTMLIYCDPDHAIVIEKKDGSKEYFDLEKIQTNDEQTNSGIIDLFVDTINGTNDMDLSGESVLTAMRAVFASLDSMEQGRSMKVENN